MTNQHGTAVVTLPSDTDINITRMFDAPAEKVFAAWTTPELVRRWWGSDEAPLTVCDIDLRVGGNWRYAMDMNDTEFAWHGTYQDIVAPTRLVSTEVFEGYPDGEALNTLTLTEIEGVTTLTVTVHHATKENRDGHIASGMEPGMQRTLNALEDLLTAKQSDLGRGTGMSEVADRWRRIAGTFTARTHAVHPDAWSNPSPCEGWTARDIVNHLVEWVPPFLRDGAGLTIPAGPSVDTDSVGAWTHLNNAVQAALDSPDIGQRIFDHPYAGHHPLDQAIERFILGDVLIHTWDLSRSTGQDEQLDPDMVASMRAGLDALGDALQQSGQYRARVPVADDADDQTRLLAATGRPC